MIFLASRDRAVLSLAKKRDDENDTSQQKEDASAHCPKISNAGYNEGDCRKHKQQPADEIDLAVAYSFAAFGRSVKSQTHINELLSGRFLKQTQIAKLAIRDKLYA